MRKLVLAVVAAVLVSGCSEMGIVAKAAFKEMGSEIVNIEQEGYRQRDARPMQPAVVAQAGIQK